MIATLRIKFGRAPGLQPETLQVTPVTVFVGPNNSGKSRVLSEIDLFCRTGSKDASAVIVDDITFNGVSNAEEVVAQVTLAPNPGESLTVGHIFVGARGSRAQVPHGQLLRFVRSPSDNVQAFCAWFLVHSTVKLDGQGRINLVQDQPAGDLQAAPTTSFQVLFRDNARRTEVRRIVSEAFGSYFVLDPTNLGVLRIRLAGRSPTDEMEERGFHDAAVKYHAAAQLIHQQSDGVKAFTGIITELVAGDPRVLLIDEPEAFLHPSLATKLGLEIARASLHSDKRVFASTHSPQFVMGCILSGAPINIVRLTYRAGVATARMLPSAELLELMRNPLLRSTGVLSGLFYEFVIVTESDSDRAFYQEINERLLRFKPEWGIPNCLFINAQNKQTVHTILRPLRKLGIPAAGIVDVDAFKEGGTVWSNFLEGVQIPSIQQQSLAILRAEVKTAMDGSGRNMKRDGGLAILSGTEREAAQNLISQLALYGLFIVPGGEVESWLKPLSVSGHGPSWLIPMFEAMGEDPDDAGYVKPTDQDVWRFLSSVRTWLVDPSRKGIPA